MNSNQLWFLATSVSIRVSCDDGHDGVSILEHLVPHGDSPPLHIHRNEDEIFHILEGNFRFEINGQSQTASPGAILLAPKGTPHSYRAESPEGGRFLTVTVHGDFERFVRAMGQPALHPGLPQPTAPPSPEAIQHLVTSAAQFGIDIVGTPLI